MFEISRGPQRSSRVEEPFVSISRASMALAIKAAVSELIHSAANVDVLCGLAEHGTHHNVQSFSQELQDIPHRCLTRHGSGSRGQFMPAQNQTEGIKSAQGHLLRSIGSYSCLHCTLNVASVAMSKFQVVVDV